MFNPGFLPPQQLESSVPFQGTMSGLSYSAVGNQEPVVQTTHRAFAGGPGAAQQAYQVQDSTAGTWQGVGRWAGDDKQIWQRAAPIEQGPVKQQEIQPSHPLSPKLQEAHVPPLPGLPAPVPHEQLKHGQLAPSGAPAITSGTSSASKPLSPVHEAKGFSAVGTSH